MPANPMKGEVALGDDHVLTLNFNVMCTLEGELGRQWGRKVSPVEISAELDAMPTCSDLRTCCWVMLGPRHSEVTRADVGDLIERLGSAVVAKAVGDAMNSFFERLKETGENPPAAA